MNDATTFIVTLIAVFVISFTRGAFGGGFAVVGIPLLALVMDPVKAGALLAPLFVLMDLVAVRYWSPSTWSKPDLRVLLPALLLGIAIGTMLLSIIDDRAVAIAIGSVTLVFAFRWFFSGAQVTQKKRSPYRAILAGTTSGMTTMIAHAGGPPLAMYLLPLGLSKTAYAGTTSVFFTVGNLVKLIPWVWLGSVAGVPWLLGLIVLPAVPLGVWAGWRVNEWLDRRVMYRILNALLVIVSAKLIWDGVSGYFV